MRQPIEAMPQSEKDVGKTTNDLQRRSKGEKRNVPPFRFFMVGTDFSIRFYVWFEKINYKHVSIQGVTITSYFFWWLLYIKYGYKHVLW